MSHPPHFAARILIGAIFCDGETSGPRNPQGVGAVFEVDPPAPTHLLANLGGSWPPKDARDEAFQLAALVNAMNMAVIKTLEKVEGVIAVEVLDVDGDTVLVRQKEGGWAPPAARKEGLN